MSTDSYPSVTTPQAARPCTRAAGLGKHVLLADLVVNHLELLCALRDPVHCVAHAVLQRFENGVADACQPCYTVRSCLRSDATTVIMRRKGPTSARCTDHGHGPDYKLESQPGKDYICHRTANLQL